jgi:hypothetical protein
MSLAHAVVWFASVFPHAESPWPRSVGIDLPLSFAGAGGLFGGLAVPDRTPEERDHVSRRLSTAGFLIGAALYLLSLGHQVLFSQ